MHQKFCRSSLVLALATFFICILLIQFPDYASAEMHEHHHGNGEMHSPGTGPDVTVKLETTPQALTAGKPSHLILSFEDAAGKPVKGLTVTHERLLHVVIASRDFSVFAHIHAEDAGPITQEMRNNARYMVNYIFPKAGRYIVAVDSAVNGQPFSRHFIVKVAGSPGMTAPVWDFSKERVSGDYSVSLSSSPHPLKSGSVSVLNFVIRKNNRLVPDLEPYLAAAMHVSIISADLNNFIHAHGEPGEKASAEHNHNMNGEMDMSMHMSEAVPAHFGPAIHTEVVFPSKGRYVIFGETKHEGHVITLQFMVNVK